MAEFAGSLSLSRSTLREENALMLRTNVFGQQHSVSRVRRIGFLVFPDAEVLDVCGPLGVFANADYQLRATGRNTERGYEARVIAAAPGLVRTQCGLQIMATHGCAETQQLDTLIVAGGIGAEAACADAVLVNWLEFMAPRVRRLASVCSGTFLLAAAGLLNDRRVTTHWMFCDRLSELYPSLRIDPDLIFVRDGHVYTSGGVTSGIDLALALVEEDLGREIAMAVARILVVFLRRPGGQTQFSPFLFTEAKARKDIRELQTWILAHPAERLDIASLADRLAMSPRSLSRNFRSQTGLTPAKFVEQARVESARCRLEQTALPAETIAADCGFGTAERMRRSFRRVLSVGPQEYRSRFQSAMGSSGTVQ
jgi:transcriptional regulator GlxA family with amidase domain